MKKSIKIFTFIDRDDSQFLDLWVKYYSKLKNSNLTILYKSSINSLILNKYPSINFINVNQYYTNNSNTSFIPPNNIFTEYQAKFLEDYDVVIYTDLDEFIVHQNLDLLLQSTFSPCLVTTGVEIVQEIGVDPTFNFTKPITSQRYNMIYSEWYNKPLIVNNIVNWIPGKHNHNQYSTYVDGLYLIHLGKICIDLLQRWANDNIRMYTNEPINWNNFLKTNPDHYKNIYNNKTSPEYPMVPIPEHIKLLINTIL